MSRPKGPGTAQQFAVEHLRHIIVDGELRPGQRVNQEQLAERLGLSVAPVREALQVLEQEGQLTYRPRRGYFLTELSIADLEEIYRLRQLLEARAARQALPHVDEEAMERIDAAARDCVDAAESGNVAADLVANRRFHFAILEHPDHPHLMRMIRLLWDSTESYRALYYNSAVERRATIDAHDRILSALRARDADALVAEMDDHRARALSTLRQIIDR